MNWVPASEKEDRSGQAWMHVDMIDAEDSSFTILIVGSQIDEDYPDEVQHHVIVTESSGEFYHDSYGETMFRYPSPYVRLS